MIRTRLAFLLAPFALLTVTSACAQWSDDPSNNLVIADADNEQVQPKIVATDDGGFYISWYDNSSGGYDVRLQRLDVSGNEQWPHNGILVADRDFSSTQDYGLSIDTAGNALLAFRYSDSGGIAQIVAQKVAADGTLQWGDEGIFVSEDAEGANAPKITGTADGGAAVGWSSSAGSILVHKMDATGTGAWDAERAPPSGFAFLGGLHGDADGNVIASWAAQLSTFDRELWTQKLAAADGSDLWGADPIKVFDGTDGALQFGYFPSFIPDGAGGAVFVWYTVGVSAGTVRVQHVTADGQQAFAQNGLQASANTSQSHVEPSGAYDSSTGDIYALWRETDITTQSQIGVYAQRIDAKGVRQWGDTGKILVALSTLDQSQMTALPTPDGLLAAWASGSTPSAMPIHAARLDRDGNYVWPSEVVDLSTEPNDIGRLTGALSSTGYAAYAWTADSSSLSGDIHAQNIDMDGQLGNPVSDTIFANGFDPE